MFISCFAKLSPPFHTSPCNAMSTSRPLQKKPGSVENWAAHIADPANNTIITFHQKVLGDLGVAMFAATAEKDWDVDAKQKQKERLATMYGPTRNLFLGPLNETAPAHLKGEFAGDYGFDVLGLAEQPKRLERFRQAEIINGRWAMLGVVGCLAPELLQKFAGVNFAEPVWFKSGAQVFGPDGIDYLGNPSLIHAQSITLILVSELLLMGAVEAFRAGGGPLGPVPADPVYVGGVFDPLGLAKDADDFAELKVKEVKNGRLAMLAIFGFLMQGLATGKGPSQGSFEVPRGMALVPASQLICSVPQNVMQRITICLLALGNPSSKTGVKRHKLEPLSALEYPLDDPLSGLFLPG